MNRINYSIGILLVTALLSGCQTQPVSVTKLTEAPVRDVIARHDNAIKNRKPWQLFKTMHHSSVIKNETTIFTFVQYVTALKNVRRPPSIIRSTMDIDIRGGTAFVTSNFIYAAERKEQMHEITVELIKGQPRITMLAAYKREPKAEPSPVEEIYTPAAPAVPSHKLTTTRRDTNVVTTFSGEFQAGDGRKIIEELRTQGATLLVLNSHGGLVDEAKQVGYFLRSNNISTMASSQCASACVFVLAGGVQRFAAEGSMVGIHRSHFPGGGGNLEQGQAIVGDYIRYFKRMDIDVELVALAADTSSGGMRWLTVEEMRYLRLITESQYAGR